MCVCVYVYLYLYTRLFLSIPIGLYVYIRTTLESGPWPCALVWAMCIVIVCVYTCRRVYTFIHMYVDICAALPMRERRSRGAETAKGAQEIHIHYSMVGIYINVYMSMYLSIYICVYFSLSL